MTETNFSSPSTNNSYAQALFELSKESTCTEIIEDQTKAILKVLNNNKDFYEMIKNPTITKDEQIKVFEIISEKFEFHNLFKKFINFLINKRRLFFIEKILKDFLSVCSEQRGEIVAKLKTSKKLSENELENIKKDLNQNFGSNIKLEYSQDTSLIGGLLLQVGSIMIDTSIKNKLKQVEKQMIEA